MQREACSPGFWEDAGVFVAPHPFFAFRSCPRREVDGLPDGMTYLKQLSFAKS